MGGSFSVVSIPRQGTEIIVEFSEKDELAPDETVPADREHLHAHAQAETA
jgi:hypothetical protein